MNENDLPDWIHPINTTTNQQFPQSTTGHLTFKNTAISYEAPTARMLAISDLSDAAKEEIRAILADELRKQEGFLRAMIQEELEAHHDAYYVCGVEHIDVPEELYEVES